MVYELAQIPRDIRCSTSVVSFTDYLNDWYWSLGRDTGHFSPDEFIKDHLAHH
jgi:hypothetical protein